VLRARLHALQRGDDFAETYLAIDAAIYGLVTLLPGDTTGASPAWHTINEILHGDLGVGVLFTTLAVALWLSLLRLIPDKWRRGVLVATFAVWVGMAVGFFTGYAWSLGPWIALLNAAAAWIAYLRADT
jgi:hypothetical protein